MRIIRTKLSEGIRIEPGSEPATIDSWVKPPFSNRGILLASYRESSFIYVKTTGSLKLGLSSLMNRSLRTWRDKELRDGLIRKGMGQQRLGS